MNSIQESVLLNRFFSGGWPAVYHAVVGKSTRGAEEEELVVGVRFVLFVVGDTLLMLAQLKEWKSMF